MRDCVGQVDQRVFGPVFHEHFVDHEVDPNQAKLVHDRRVQEDRRTVEVNWFEF